MRKAILVFMIFTASLWGQQPAQLMSANSSGDAAAGSSDDRSPAFSQRFPRYRLEAGDSFDVLFEFVPELNQSKVTVQPDGFVTLKNVGDVHVTGLTVPELTAQIRGAYDRILQNAALTVVLKDFEKPYFIADGQVGHPGKYELRGDTTVTAALAMAGGLLDSAKHSQVVLFRKVSDSMFETKVLNVKKMHNQRDLSEDVQLRPGDVVYVPKSTFSKIEHYIPRANVQAFTPNL
jgi:polysaccharide biosynthesis/export protein